MLCVYRFFFVWCHHIDIPDTNVVTSYYTNNIFIQMLFKFDHQSHFKSSKTLKLFHVVINVNNEVFVRRLVMAIKVDIL